MRSSAYRYLASLLLVPLFGAGLIVGINSAVDSLWYFDRPALPGQERAVFNEFIARLNRLERDPNHYECVIIGSSRASLLHDKEINGEPCINMAFSGADAAQIKALAEYLRERHDMAPRYVVVGVDNYNLTDAATFGHVPDFVRDYEAPPSLWQSYFSLFMLRRSIEHWIEPPFTILYYDKEYRAHPRQTGDGFIPVLEPRLGSFMPLREHSLNNAHYYASIDEIFPEATTIGFMPPIHPCYFHEMTERDLFDNYLQTMYGLGQSFDLFFDFTFPTDTIADTASLGDWMHYYPPVVSRVSNDLSVPAQASPHAINSIPYETYYGRFLNALRNVDASRSCGPRPPVASETGSS